MFVDDQDERNGEAAGVPPRSFESNENDVLFGDFDHSDIPFEDEEWPVVIIGSSMVGMMTWLLLGFTGKRLVESGSSRSVLTFVESKVFRSTVIRRPARTLGQLV